MEYIHRKGGSNAVAEPFWSAFAECIPSVWLCVVWDFRTINFQFTANLFNAINFNISTLPKLRIAFVGGMLLFFK